ncbi:MAG: T9SS type A sorting domain-containing protein [Saprospiraceae bacterium]|nr:T9SS type A sorting domain-containing protein [Saprospiraceae bacterium]MDW8230184.1 T9SS type A sorting domain-containing protein [Saprospiraceae bacterium]
MDTIKMDSASYIDQVYYYKNPSTNQSFKLDYIYAIEGLNEPEHFIPSGSDTASHVQNFYKQKWDEITYRTQVGMFNKITANNNYKHIKVLAPSIWKFYEGAINSLTAQGPIQNYFEAGNLHPYPNVIQSSYSWDKLKYHPIFYVPLYLKTFYGSNSNYGNNYPKYVTETGYQSQRPPYDTTFSDIDESAAAKYMSFLHLEFLNNGIEKVLFYKLLENGYDPKDDRYALIKSNYSAKPVFNTLKNISKILSDTSKIQNRIDKIAFTINYISPGIFNLKAYQQKDNQIILAIWRKDANSACYDINNTVIPVLPINFSIVFGNNFKKAYLYDPVNSGLATDSLSESKVINLSLADRALLIKIIYENSIGLSDNHIEDVANVYPNPATNSIYIDSKYTTEFKSIQIFDSYGRQLLYSPSIVLPKEISIQGFSPGWYVLKLETSNHEYVTKKFIVTHP